MRCCVLGCKNDSRHISKSQGITFHVIPTEPNLRLSWLRAIGKEKCKERSSVCSEHFLAEDLYETKSGLRKVRLGAIPIVLRDNSNCEFGEPAGLKVCRICLVTDTKMIAMRKYNLEQAYRHLTGITLNTNDMLPQKFCFECANRLVSYNKFREKSLRANSLLTSLANRQDHSIKSTAQDSSLSLNDVKSIRNQIFINEDFTEEQMKDEKVDEEIDGEGTLDEETVDQNDDLYFAASDKEYSSDDCVPLERKRTIKKLSLQSIKSINRDINQLSSTLSVRTFSPDHHDLYIQEPTLTKPDDLSLDEVKDESPNEIFVNEDFTEEQMKDEKVDEEINGEETVDEETGAVDQDDDLDQDFAASDKDYSSDDSVPLERKRTKKKTKQPKPKLQKDTVKKVRKRQVKKDPAEPKIDRRRKPFLNNDLNETLFTITDLTFEEQVAEILKRQESANYKNAVFKCTECFKGFLDEDAYSGHMSRHTKDCGDYQCDICKTHFKHPHALRKHITAHHTQRFSCNQCPYVTTHRQTARLHERWHKGTKYQCPHCPEEFVKFTTYMGHIRIKHPSDFVCQLCGFSFVSEKGIELHKKLKHRLESDEIPEDGPFCELCNVRFVSPEALRQHIRVSARHNTTDKDQRESNKPKKGRKSKEAKERERKARDKSCKDLDERRVYPSQIRKAEGPIPCEQCGMQLEDSRAYHGHFRRMHPDKNRTNYPSMKSPCMCELCGRMFQSYALLKDHSWVHTGERPFKCESCGKSFRMKQRLVAHRRVHAQMKASFACGLCGKHFSTQSNRQRHMFIHTGLKPFKCEMCGKCFKHASEKRAHITYVHLKKPWPKRSRGKRRSDSRQGQLPPPPTAPTSASEMDIVQPLWPCDPKLDHISELHRKTEKDWRHVRCSEGWNE